MNITTKRLSILIIMVVILLNISGCWNRREIDDLALSTALGIDRVMVSQKPRYEISMLILKPSELTQNGGMSGSSGKPSGAQRVITAQGETIEDALRNWNLRSPRQLFLSHNMVILIGEDTARHGVSEIIDFLMRNKDTRLRAKLVVCPGRAMDALQTMPELEQLTSLEMTGIMEGSSRRVSKTADIDIKMFAVALVTPGLEPVAGRMRLFTPPESSSPIKQKGQSGTPSNSTPGSEKTNAPENQTFTMSGGYVFFGDRLIGNLDEGQTQGYNFITGRADAGIIPIPLKAKTDNTSLLFREGHSNIKPVIKGDHVEFNVLVAGTGELLEEGGKMKISYGSMKQYEKLVNQEITRRCYLAINKAKNLNSDIFGLGDQLHKHKPQVWHEVGPLWKDMFPTVQVNIKTEFTVEHTGVASDPLELR